MSIEVTKDDEKRFNKAINEYTHTLDEILKGMMLCTFFISGFLLIFCNVLLSKISIVLLFILMIISAFVFNYNETKNQHKLMKLAESGKLKEVK